MISEKKHSHYNYHRWYNPDIGRYMEVDPYKIIRLEEGIVICAKKPNEQKVAHRYLYSNNNTVIFFDKFGYKCRKVDSCKNCLYNNLDDDELRNKVKNAKYDCDPTGTRCIAKGTACCGYVRNGKIYITDTCDDTCHTILHEIAHLYYGVSDKNDEANKWASDRLPECCKL